MSASVRMESQAGTSRAAESKPHPYDVFINHRGPDVRKTLVAHLVAALRKDGLRPFLDANDIEHGRHLFNSIGEALKGSRVYVAIFSQRYAESRHCLNELCKMLESGKAILPVFYHVDPGDLKLIKNSAFKDGFRKRIKHETEEQILRWKDALCKIIVYRGLRLDEVNWNEEELVRKILAEVLRLMATVLPSAIEGPGVEPSDTEASEEPIVTFNAGDRRLNTLVLGDPESVEAVIGRICGAARRQTLVEDHGNLRESRNSSPPICLYSHTQGIMGNALNADIRNFVKARNEKWCRAKVKALWANQVYEPGPRNWLALFPDSTLRLHMVWFACRKLSDLPNLLDWPEITKKLCDLPVQILVIEKQGTRALEISAQQEFNIIFENGSDYFPNAQMCMMDLIVKVSFQDDDLKGKLWCKCWAVKTRAEIENAAKIIREIREKLGSAGKSIQMGYGGARMRKEVSLSRSGEFVLNFLCAHWDIPQESFRRVLQNLGTNFVLQARESKISIERGKFVEFCLKVAGIILYYARDNARNPKYVCSWNVDPGSSLDQSLQTEARECFNSYFPSSNSLDYDKMRFEAIRLFLESIFERDNWDPRHAVIRDSFISTIMKLLCPRGRSVSPGMTPEI